MLACFFQGLVCFLLRSSSRSSQMRRRVVEGKITSSTKPGTHNTVPHTQQEKVATMLHSLARDLTPAASRMRTLTSSSRHQRISELLFIVAGFLVDILAAEDNLNRTFSPKPYSNHSSATTASDQQGEHSAVTFGSHHSDLSGRPGIVHISTQMLG